MYKQTLTSMSLSVLIIVSGCSQNNGSVEESSISQSNMPTSQPVLVDSVVQAEPTRELDEALPASADKYEMRVVESERADFAKNMPSEAALGAVGVG